jgi:hypothetical protein
MNSSVLIPLIVEEHSGIRRIDEPVTVGIPLPRGGVFELMGLALFDDSERQLPLQAQVLSRWCDASIKWVLLDFEVSVEPNGLAELQLRGSDELTSPIFERRLSVAQCPQSLLVATGRALFFLNAEILRPFDRVVVQGSDVLAQAGSGIVLTDALGRCYEPKIRRIAVEAEGPIRISLAIQGEFVADNRSLANFTARINFYAGHSFIEMKLTLQNPRAATHLGGLWDLGDPGSIYFRDLSLHTCLACHSPLTIEWTTQPQRPVQKSRSSTIEIYQDSSGGPNWDSSNHLNRFRKAMNTFRGYRVMADGMIIREGGRASPVVLVRSDENGLAGAIEGFWQNFPKAIEVKGNRLSIRVFPHQYHDLYELQGGEQKTHTLFLHFGRNHEPATGLTWIHDRLIPRSTPDCYAQSKAIDYLTPRYRDINSQCLALIDTAVIGSNTFFHRREIIDEYGWRHFGDLYADHEAVGHKGEAPLVSHYNNQYDAIYGALIQYLRSGDVRWFHLMNDLAKHVIDIDIYHTQEDRQSYNGGMFWHTDHYVDAATATHRTYSKANLATKGGSLYGGGPSNEHNYTTGLLHYYFLTGEPSAGEAVQSLADWVINMDDGSRRLLGFFDRRPTGLASSTTSRSYHGPGRGAGNSVNALIDAYLLTGHEKYLSKAEELIRRCIHPRDEIAKRNLHDVEHRWSYTVFLQILGKYLDFKIDRGEVDFTYGYARESLLHYAKWMLEHEVPYKSILDQVEIPTETWPAQDIRKSNIFEFAAKHSDEPLRTAFFQKASFFFQTCIRDLQSFETCLLTRPLVLLMTNAFRHAYFQLYAGESAPHPDRVYGFGAPQEFTPQLYRLYRAKERLREVLHTAKDGGRHLTRLLRNCRGRAARIHG